MTTLLAPDPLSILGDPGASLSQIMAALTNFEEAGQATRHASVGLSSNATIELLGVFLRKHAALSGVQLTVHQGNFDDPIGDINRFRQGSVEHLVLLPVFDALLPSFEAQLGHLSPESVAAKEAEVIARYRLAFEQASGFRSVFVSSFHRLSSSAEPAAKDAVDASIERLDRALREAAAQFPNIRILDLDAVVTTLGRNAAFDGRFYLRNKAPYTTGFLNELARRIAATSRGFGSYFYKALVLDCDNTLWGGTIGEDLLAGIKLGPYDYPGNVFWQVQNEIAALERSGVLLCLCSKNNPADAEEVFARHPDMVLRDRHLVLKKVNWADKPSNLREIAAELNIGLDSLVFLDDSPFECGAVRAELPMVRTIQVPAALAEFPRVIREIKELFLAGGVTEESRSKTEQYRQRAAADVLKSQFSSNDEYLASLNLRVELSRDAEASLARLSELSQKSNQFNLTTRRYSESDMRRALDCPDTAVYSLVVGDKFGNAGLTGVAVVRWNADTAVVEAFLMSCRVIGRGIEFAIWPAILRDAAAHGCTRIAATYSPSAKNAQVADFWERAGLSPTAAEDGICHYGAEIAGFTCPPTPWIEVIRC
ncbi:MAG: FkbH protein [Rhodospirillales bacterium]|nr:FkbH protein [Rhodospirillales bacterium]